MVEKSVFMFNLNYSFSIISIVFPRKTIWNIMPTPRRIHNAAPGLITFPPTETVHLDTATLQRLREEGLQFRREVEKSSARMFAVSSSESSVKMR